MGREPISIMSNQVLSSSPALFLGESVSMSKCRVYGGVKSGYGRRSRMRRMICSLRWRVQDSTLYVMVTVKSNGRQNQLKGVLVGSCSPDGIPYVLYLFETRD